MKLRTTHILGLAISERAILCAQVAASQSRAGRGAGERWTVQRLGRFELTDAACFAKPVELGQTFRAFLKQNHFTASHTVIGVPAKWLIAHDRALPPSSVQQAGAMLRLQTESLIVADNADLVFDYVGSPSATTASRVLIVGILRQHLDRLTQMADAAGLAIRGVSSTSLVTSALAEKADDRTIVMLGEGGAELVVRQAGVPQGLRHVTLAGVERGVDIERLSGDVRRALAFSPRGGNGQLHQPLLWDGIGLDDEQRGALTDRSGLEVHVAPTFASARADLAPDALNGSRGTVRPESLAPAVALAVAGAGAARLPVDFANSRLKPPPVRRINRRMVLAVAAAVAVVGGLVSLYVSVLGREAEAITLEAQLKQMAPDIAAARAAIDRVTYGRGYFETRPPVLDCMKDVTLAIREDDPLWVTSFNVRENGRGQVQGKATDQRAILGVLDRLKSNPSFANVQLQDMREASGRSREVTFSVSFDYLPMDQPR